MIAFQNPHLHAQDQSQLIRLLEWALVELGEAAGVRVLVDGEPRQQSAEEQVVWSLEL